MTPLRKNVEILLRILDEEYKCDPTSWWPFNPNMLKAYDFDITSDAMFYKLLADKKLIDLHHGSNGGDNLRLTKYGHDNIDNLDPILFIPSNTNCNLN